MTSVCLTSVSKAYGTVAAVDDLSFSADPGEFVTLLGPSGCGKTTTLRMVAGFVAPTAGRIEIGPRDVTHLAPNRRDVGLVFQSYALFPHMTVADNVAFGLKMRGLPRADRAPRVAEALGMVQLTGLERRYPRQLSGGQQQRVALARALVIKPQLLLLDEPFGALDKQLRDHMREELLALQRRLGIATLFVTHDQEEALALSDRVIVMNHGKVEQIGPPAEIYERPRSRFVAEFLGRSNLLQMHVTGISAGEVRLACGPLHVVLPGADNATPGQTVTAMIRPEAIGLTVEPLRGTPARVVSVTYLGATIQARVAIENGPSLEVLTSRRDLNATSIPVGDRVGVEIFPGGVWILAGLP